MKIYSRARWGAKPPKPMSKQDDFRNGGFVHWTINDTDKPKNFDDQCKAMRDIQHFHMVTRGWSDVGYHYIVFQRRLGFFGARVFAARPYDCIPAAQEGYNTRTLAVAVYMGPGDQLKPGTRRAILRIMKKHGIPRSRIFKHSDKVATGCPGPLLSRWVDSL